jgi:hypothetical protein
VLEGNVAGLLLQTYSLFGVGDGMSSLWQACNSVISTVAEPSTLNPTQVCTTAVQPPSPAHTGFSDGFDFLLSVCN